MKRSPKAEAQGKFDAMVERCADLGLELKPGGRGVGKRRGYTLYTPDDRGGIGLISLEEVKDELVNWE